jgi:alpha-galactosidase
MPILTVHEHTLGDILVRYVAPHDQPQAVGLVLIPATQSGAVVSHREHMDTLAVRNLPARWQPQLAWEIDPLVHVRLGDEPAAGGFSQGRSLRAGPTSRALRLHAHTRTEENGVTILRTILHAPGVECVHELRHHPGEPGLRVRSSVRNLRDTSLTLELLTAFSLTGLSPFATDDAPGRLHLHRARMSWSAEARLVEDTFERLALERTWGGYGLACERFGAVGSMPVNGWHPYAAVEDRAAQVVWAAQLATPGSWQMEAFRQKDFAGLCGGGADREFGHWQKHLAPGESHTSPEALLTVVHGSLADAGERLVRCLKSSLRHVPASERDLPVLFNEWCTSWGSPTHENLSALATRLKGSGVRYLVIDDGWAERPADASMQSNGDWKINLTAFPGGLRATCDAIRAAGLIPGIWFEFEVCNPGSAAWNETAHHLHRDGRVLEVGNRRFWDFRDPWVHDYLQEKIIRLLKENGLGYLKVDYNDTIGLGCDGAESLGEGLRQHLEGVQRFFRRLRQQIPDLVIENCSSGGHRIEPSFLGLTSMSSFSDAHESEDIPIIAAGLLHLIPAAQNQIWAVLHAADTRQRLAYSLAATFLGRMCLSGEVHALSAESWSFTREAIALYRGLAPMIATGSFRRFGHWGEAWQHPTGAQAVRCEDAATGRAFIVWHAFAEPPASLMVPLSAPFAEKPHRPWSDLPVEITRAPGALEIHHPRPWSGGIIALG